MRITTKRLVLAIAATTLVATGPGQARGGDITYQLVNYADAQNGYTLSGTITTDGNLGALGGADIISWNYSITQGTEKDSESGPGSWGTEVQGLIATPSQLTLPEPASYASYNYFYLWLPPDPGHGVYYGNANGSDGTAPFYWGVLASGNFAWDTVFPTTSPSGATFIIANDGAQAVPEPSTLALGTVGLASVGCIAAYGLARKRRARRRARNEALSSGSDVVFVFGLS